jgi:hypothetical protein
MSMQDDLEVIKKAGEVLGAAANVATAKIRNLDEVLAASSVGIEVWVEVPGEWHLGYARVEDGELGVAARWRAPMGGAKARRLSKCSRAARLTLAPHLPRLVARLREAAVQAASEVECASGPGGRTDL